MKKNLLSYPHTQGGYNKKGNPEMSEAELKLWAELRKKQIGANFKRKVAYGPYILDFYSSVSKLVIEVNRKRHDTEIGRQKDEARDAYLQKEGLKVIRFSAHEIMASVDGILQKIWLHLNKNEDDPV